MIKRTQSKNTKQKIKNTKSHKNQKIDLFFSEQTNCIN
jgi:hypothetical protein